ncbi:hypothetical protein AG4045_002720 [Apium graveolens]|uniref:RING-type domain-containing protein n=1 Tax=Apium graveolens TaxID=4045 RepID=A0A6L5BC06_APIGR|nr:hypothetical protein AG4045_002720 [Apium graveolens]
MHNPDKHSQINLYIEGNSVAYPSCYRHPSRVMEEYSTVSPTNFSGSREICFGTSIEEFRSRIPAVNYDSLCSHKQLEHECSVCLTEFKPEAVINHLSCGHVFHKSCLDKWLKYRNVTCPNCRKHMIPAEDEEDTCPM